MKKIKAWVVANEISPLIQPLFKNNHRKNCDGKCNCNGQVWGQYMVFTSRKAAQKENIKPFKVKEIMIVFLAPRS